MREFDCGWKDLDSRLKLVPGKEFIAALSGSLQREFGTTVTTHQLVDDMRHEEIDPDLGAQLSGLSEFFDHAIS